MDNLKIKGVSEILKEKGVKLTFKVIAEVLKAEEELNSIKNNEDEKPKEDAIFIKQNNIMGLNTRKNGLVYESDIDNLVKLEMNECRKINERENFKNELEFFTQHARRDEYMNVISSRINNVFLTKNCKKTIQNEVVDRITKIIQG